MLAQWKCLPLALTFPWGITNQSTLRLLSKGNWGQRHRSRWGFAGHRHVLNIRIHHPTTMTLCPSELCPLPTTAVLISSGLATQGRSHTTKWGNGFKGESCCCFFLKKLDISCCLLSSNRINSLSWVLWCLRTFSEFPAYLYPCTAHPYSLMFQKWALTSAFIQPVYKVISFEFSNHFTLGRLSISLIIPVFLLWTWPSLHTAFRERLEMFTVFQARYPMP